MGGDEQLLYDNVQDVNAISFKPRNEPLSNTYNLN
jgi:hypothetical protein